MQRPHGSRGSSLICRDGRAAESGFAPMDNIRAQPLFRVAAADKRRTLGIASDWPFGQLGRFLSKHTITGSLLARLLHHASVVVISGTQSCS